MTSAPEPKPRRRDLLTTSALVLSAGGLLATLWPLLSAMQPDEETRARQQIFNLARLAETGQALVNLNGIPILIFRRSQDELKALVGSKASHSALPAHRSQRPEIMVVNARCPQDACIVVRNETYTGGVLRCPCCASTFDLAGRRTGGRAGRDLDIPPYRFLSDFEIELGEV
jgi:ubiquinol-cytochrome c reductase iron-sulfur subunit